MKDPLPDSTILLIIIGTLIMVFLLIFSMRPSEDILQPTLQWKDPPAMETRGLQI